MPKTTGDPEPLLKLAVILKSLPQAVVTLSGGMDSGFLLWACTRFIDRSRIKAVTFHSPTTPRQELARAVHTIQVLQVEHIILATPEMEDESFCCNDLLRCYHCKRSRIAYLLHNLEDFSATILDGSHVDDLREHRPGMKALSEFNVISPLLEAGLDRAAIQSLCHLYDLPFTERPPESCLATRIKTGQRLNADLMARLDKLEEAVRDLGISLVRARYNNGEIRLEVRTDEISTAIAQRNSILQSVKSFGFENVALDISGYGPNNSASGEK